MPTASPGTRSCLLWLADTSEDISRIGASRPREPPASRWQGGLAPEVGMCPRPLKIRLFSRTPVLTGSRVEEGLDGNLALSADFFPGEAGLSTWTI